MIDANNGRNEKNTHRCGHHADVSPENKDCAWCEMFRINLDRVGRICERCENDSRFRETLKRQAAVRFGGGCASERSFCEIFGCATDYAQCERCKSDGEFRAFLNGQMAARKNRQRETQVAGCGLRGETLRTERRGCCGGEIKTIVIYNCSVHGEANEARCAECPDWQAP